MLMSDHRGIYHVTNAGDSSWYEFARAIVAHMGLSTDVRSISTAQAGRLAKRPAYSVLSQERFASHFKPLPPWQDALTRYMKRVSTLVSPA